MRRIWAVKNADDLTKMGALHKNIQEGTETNKKVWEELAPFKFEQFYSDMGFNLCETIVGVIPLHKKLLVDPPLGWKTDKKMEGALVPDKRRKEGKWLNNELFDKSVQIPYKVILETLNLPNKLYGRFTLPQIYKAKDEIFVVLDGRYDLEIDARFEEVTLSYVNKKLKEANS